MLAPAFAPLIALGPFGSWLMLFWALAALIPILIHLWSKRRYRETSWAAMEFLLRAMKKNSRRIQLEQLILLAMRASILLLLALALAEPGCSTLPLTGGTSLGGGQTHAVLVFDGSYSMDYRRGEQTLFEAAQKLASDIVRHARQGDGFTLVLMAEPPRVIIAHPAFDAQDIISEIRALRPLHAGADLLATLAEVERVVEAAQRDHPRLTQHKVCFFTDLGETTWSAATGNDVRQRIGSLSNRAALTLIDLGELDAQNLAVTRLEPQEPLATIARDAVFLTEIRNFGSQSVERREVEFTVDGQVMDTKSISVEPGGAATLSFANHFESPGEHSVEVRLSSDNLEIDNHRHLSVPVRESIRVLCVQGKPGAADHLAYALAPVRSNQPRVRVETVVESYLLELDLNNYDAIFLANIGRFGSDEAGVLYQYLNGGGGIVIFLGDQVQSDAYNLALVEGAADKRVIPAKLGEAIFSEAGFVLDPMEYRHPIVRVFEGHARAGLLTTPIWKYIRLSPVDENKSKIAVALTGGDPLIIEESISRGRSLLVATAASNNSVHRTSESLIPWSTMALWPSFPPLVQEMLTVALSGRTENRNVLVGEELTALASVNDTAVSVMLTGPNNHRERIPLREDGDQRLWTHPGLDISGLYSLDYDFGGSRQMFAVNVDARESDLSRIDLESLPNQFNQTYESESDTIPANAFSQPRQEWFRWFLIGVVFLLISETLYAWKIGRHAG